MKGFVMVCVGALATLAACGESERTAGTEKRSNYCRDQYEQADGIAVRLMAQGPYWQPENTIPEDAIRFIMASPDLHWSVDPVGGECRIKIDVDVVHNGTRYAWSGDCPIGTTRPSSINPHKKDVGFFYLNQCRWK